jgi:hypothetical protein
MHSRCRSSPPCARLRRGCYSSAGGEDRPDVVVHGNASVSRRASFARPRGRGAEVIRQHSGAPGDGCGGAPRGSTDRVALTATTASSLRASRRTRPTAVSCSRFTRAYVDRGSCIPRASTSTSSPTLITQCWQPVGPTRTHRSPPNCFHW